MGSFGKKQVFCWHEPAQKTALGLLEVDHDLLPESGTGDFVAGGTGLQAA